MKLHLGDVEETALIPLAVRAEEKTSGSTIRKQYKSLMRLKSTPETRTSR